MKKDSYTILGIEDKATKEFTVAYAVDSEDIPRFKLLLTVPVGTKADIIERVNSAALSQLQLRRDKIAKEARETADRENIENVREQLKADILNMKGTGTPIRKPKEKKARLEAPHKGEDKK